MFLWVVIALYTYGLSASSFLVAELAVSEIVLERQKFKSTSSAATFEPRQICHIINSVKNQQELDLLRLVYLMKRGPNWAVQCDYEFTRMR